MVARARPMSVSSEATPTNLNGASHAFTVLMVERLPYIWLPAAAGYNSVAMEWFQYP